MVAITYTCPNCHQHGSHKEDCPSWYGAPEYDGGCTIPDCPCHEWLRRPAIPDNEHEIRKQGLIATAGLIAADRQERELAALVPRLLDTLDLTQKLLINQTSCERSLCVGCEDARRTVLSAVEDTLAIVKGVRG